MSDVLDKLKKVRAFGPETESTRNEAAAEIKRLRGQIARLNEPRMCGTPTEIRCQAFLDAAKMADALANAKCNFEQGKALREFATELRQAAEGVKDE